MPTIVKNQDRFTRSFSIKKRNLLLKQRKSVPFFDASSFRILKKINFTNLKIGRLKFTDLILLSTKDY
ncbi:hypothetical protein DLM75_01370 [Leptospira stimsonii]|uniref:Uncharacterized protein n=1 Tax=Leptospira stimsonii TaxID=2202203 RepID=A0A396ZEK5_9LEPT|nr:hypothetical protein DLM75_01370 [Leptospira stimsonii]